MFLAVAVLLAGTLVVKWVPRLENEWKEAEVEVGSAQAMLIHMSLGFQTWTLVWLPGTLALASAALFVVLSKRTQAESLRDGDAAG